MCQACIPRPTIPEHAQNEKCFASHWEIAILICNGTRGVSRQKKRREGRHCAPQATKHTLSACRCSLFQPLPSPLSFSSVLLVYCTFIFAAVFPVACLHLYEDSEVHACMQVRSLTQTTPVCQGSSSTYSRLLSPRIRGERAVKKKCHAEFRRAVYNMASDDQYSCDNLVAV